MTGLIIESMKIAMCKPLTWMAGALAVLATGALGEDGFAADLPKVKDTSAATWWSILVIAVALLATAVVAFKNAKRIHQQ